MTDNALHTHTGGTDANIARLIDGGLLAVQGPGPLDVRTGVLIGPGSRNLVTGTSDTGPMTVAIASHHWVTSRGAANGAYRGVKVASSKVPIAAAPGAGAGTRIDVVYEKQQDETPTVPSKDDTTAPLYGVLQGDTGAGKPDLSTIVGAEEVATVEVSAGATSTNGANVLITNTARQTTTRGGVVPVKNQAERVALQTAGMVFPTLQVLELDTGRLLWHDGTRFRYDGDRVQVSNAAGRDALTAYAGLQARAADTGITWEYSGTSWLPVDVAAYGCRATAVQPAGGVPPGQWWGPGALSAVEQRGGWTAPAQADRLTAPADGGGLYICTVRYSTGAAFGGTRNEVQVGINSTDTTFPTQQAPIGVAGDLVGSATFLLVVPNSATLRFAMNTGHAGNTNTSTEVTLTRVAPMLTA